MNGVSMRYPHLAFGFKGLFRIWASGRGIELLPSFRWIMAKPLAVNGREWLIFLDFSCFFSSGRGIGVEGERLEDTSPNLVDGWWDKGMFGRGTGRGDESVSKQIAARVGSAGISRVRKL